MVTHLLVWPGVASSHFLPSSPPSFEKNSKHHKAIEENFSRSLLRLVKLFLKRFFEIVRDTSRTLLFSLHNISESSYMPREWKLTNVFVVVPFYLWLKFSSLYFFGGWVVCGGGGWGGGVYDFVTKEHKI